MALFSPRFTVKPNCQAFQPLCFFPRCFLFLRLPRARHQRPLISTWLLPRRVLSLKREIDHFLVGVVFIRMERYRKVSIKKLMRLIEEI